MKKYRQYNRYLIYSDRRLLFIAPLLLLTLLFSYGCKKSYIKKHYTGNFNFTVYRSKQQFSDTIFCDTLSFQGTISYDKDNEILTITYLPDKSFDSLITKDGILNCYVSTGALSPAIHGKFNNENEIEFSYTWGFDQYACWMANDNVIGERQ